MSEKRFDIVGKEFVGYTEGYAYIIRDNSIVCEPHRWRQWSVWEDKEDVEDLCDLLNELHDENQLLKCALALDAITNISLNDKKVDIPPYYEFENYQQLKKERREEYDEYW